MEANENAFPLDFYAEDPSPRPWKFRPEGYLVVIVSDAEEGEGAAAALVGAGFNDRDVKVYSSDQILQNFETYMTRKNLTDRVVGFVVDDADGRDRYLASAREGASALWVRLPDESDVPKALRVLADTRYVHARYYGSGRQDDFRVEG